MAAQALLLVNMVLILRSSHVVRPCVDPQSAVQNLLYPAPAQRNSQLHICKAFDMHANGVMTMLSHLLSSSLQLKHDVTARASYCCHAKGRWNADQVAISVPAFIMQNKGSTSVGGPGRLYTACVQFARIPFALILQNLCKTLHSL